jgi:hypothetical protein
MLFDLIEQLRLRRLDRAPISSVIRFNLREPRASCGDHVPQWHHRGMDITGLGMRFLSMYN